MSAIHYILRHLLQVVRLTDILGIERFILEISSITVDLHLADIRKTGTAHHVGSQLMNPRFAHPNLCPFSACQHRMVGIGGRRILPAAGLQSGFLLRTCQQIRLALRTFQRLRLDIQHEAHQRLISVLPEDERRKGNYQQALFPAFGYLLADGHLLRESSARKSVIMRNIGSRHIHILRIFHCYRIDRILIITLQRQRIYELRQYGVHLHLLRGKVEESLCSSRQRHQHQHCHDTEVLPYSTLIHILFLFTHKVEHLSIFEIALQMVVDLHRTASCRTTRIEQISSLERKILADVGDDFIHLVEHIARTAFLHILAVDVEMEVDSLDITELLDIHPFADGGRTVEALGKLPRLSSLSQLLLHLACGKVDAHGHRIIIAMGETLRNGLAQLADTHHQFGLILYSSQMIRDEERLAVVEQRRISLGKNNRTLWFR